MRGRGDQGSEKEARGLRPEHVGGTEKAEMAGVSNTQNLFQVPPVWRERAWDVCWK